MASVDPLAPLRVFEEARRRDARFLEQPPQDRAFGADPYDLAALPDGRIAGVLRGRDALVLLDASLREVARAPTPRSPTAIVACSGTAGALQRGDLLVASEIAPVLAHYRVHDASITRLADIPLGDAAGVRDLAIGPEGVVHVVEEHDDRLLQLAFSANGFSRTERRVARGPVRLARTKNALFVASLLDHTLTAFALDDRGQIGAPTTATIDGPYWGIAARDDAEGTLVLAGGAEDHPLDRRGGYFGYVDSFVYGYRYEKGSLRRVSATNVSERGLIVPKAIAFGSDGSALVTSYGGSVALRLSDLSTLEIPPGTSAVVPTATGFVAANPLLDAWVAIDSAARVVRIPDAPRDDRERLGEALFFTGLMAPGSSAEGARSRFSCETCHFEGYVDGRVHHTGRGDVRATTKPLVGLFNNRPHFSRALDPDLAAVAENEFRVAGAPSTADPHFELRTADAPWLAELGLGRTTFDAAELRLSLMSFLMAWSHRTNPRATGRTFTDVERRGALAFRDRCEHCHEARAAADVPSSRAPFERWESLVLEGGGALVWASDAYAKTGIVPYVHERGARVPSLRRLYKKAPFFTNGSSPDLASVLARARSGEEFSHAGDTGEEFDGPTQEALARFLDLL